MHPEEQLRGPRHRRLIPQAGKMWYQIHKIMKLMPFEEKYESLMLKVKEAADYGSSGLTCSDMRFCSSKRERATQNSSLSANATQI